MEEAREHGPCTHHFAGDDIVYVDGGDAIDSKHDDEDDDLNTGHPDREVRTAPTNHPPVIYCNN